MTKLNLLVGDCVEKLKEIPTSSVHSIVTDPPYNLNFDDRNWDNFKTNKGFEFWCKEWGKQCYRILRPGGFIISFSATRTVHRLACGLEDAGFDIKDTLNWIYFSGMPKSISYGKRDSRLEGCSTALKPCFEPAILAQKAIKEKNVSEQFLKSRTGMLHVETCRFPYGDECWVGPQHDHSSLWDKPVTTNMTKGGKYKTIGTHKKVDLSKYKPEGGRYPGNIYQCKKASKAERNLGLNNDHSINENPHPTVKPLKLMSWCVRLVTPKGGTVVDPFLGSGSTAIAAITQGYNCIGVELNPLYADVIKRRIEWFESQIEQGHKFNF